MPATTATPAPTTAVTHRADPAPRTTRPTPPASVTDLGALATALLSSAAFGLSGPFAKSLLDAGWSPSAAVLARTGLSALVLLPAVVRACARRRPSRRDLRMIGAYGVMAVAGTQLAYFSAVQTLSVGVALLLEYLAPVLLVGLAWAQTRRAPGRRTLLGTALSMAGLVLVLDLTGSVAVDGIGVLWGLTAAVCLCSYFLLSAKIDDALPPVVLAGGGLAVGTVVIAVVGAAGIVPLRASTAPVQLVGQTVSWLVPVAVLVLVSTVTAYMTGIRAAARLGSRVASFVGLTEVLFAVLSAWLLLGQLPVAIQLVGGLGILAGVALVHRDADDAVAVAVPAADDSAAVGVPTAGPA